jgi:hypothetical protein
MFETLILPPYSNQPNLASNSSPEHLLARTSTMPKLPNPDLLQLAVPFTPRHAENNRRLDLKISPLDRARFDRTTKSRWIKVTETDSGKQWRVRKADCTIRGCRCDAIALPLTKEPAAKRMKKRNLDSQAEWRDQQPEEKTLYEAIALTSGDFGLMAIGGPAKEVRKHGDARLTKDRFKTMKEAEEASYERNAPYREQEAWLNEQPFFTLTRGETEAIAILLEDALSSGHTAVGKSTDDEQAIDLTDLRDTMLSHLN